MERCRDERLHQIQHIWDRLLNLLDSVHDEEPV
jgi:hypothetical protein